MRSRGSMRGRDPCRGAGRRPGSGTADLLLTAFAVLTVLAVVAAPPAARAQPGAVTGSLTIDAAVGFSDTFRPGRRAPVTVTVSNDGPDLDAWLEVVSTDGDAFRGQGYRVIHQRRLALTRGARKRFHFTVYLPGLSQPLTVRVGDGEREIARHAVDLRRRFTAERLLLVVSRDADLDYLNEPGGRGLRVLYPHPDRLPHRWQGYDGVSAVLLHGVALERLAPAQFEALIRWVAAGGVLAVSGGPDFTLLRSPRYAALLPAIPVGTATVGDPAAAGAALGVTLAGAAPFLVHRLAEAEAEVLHAVAGRPLVVAKARGRGRVVYLAFDVARPPFERLAGLAPLWRRLLDLPLEGSAGDLLDAKEAPPGVSPVKAVLGGRRGGFPGHGTVLVFLALYLGLLATGHRLQVGGATGRRLLPLLTWAAPLVFAPAAWLLFGPLLFDRGTATVMVATVEPLPGSAYARLHLDLGLYRHRRGALRFGYSGADPTFRVPVRWRADAGAEAWLFNEDAAPFVEPLDRRPFVLHLLEGRDVIPFAVDGALARAGATTLALALHNRSGWPLTEAWLVADGRAYALGDVAHGARVQRQLDAQRDALPVGDDGWSAVLARWSGLTRPEREAARAVIARGAAEHGEAALLVARTRSPLRLTAGEDEWRRTELVLVLAPLSLAPAPAEAVP